MKPLAFLVPFLLCGCQSANTTKPVDATPATIDADPASPPRVDANIPVGTGLIENYSPPGGGLVWTCADGTEIKLTSAVSKQSTLCLGIDGSECRSAGKPGPGDAQCEDPNFNGFKNTCVEEYFSCFQPSGTCTILGNRNQEWSNGALQDRGYMGFVASYFPDASGQPCITASLGSGVVNYTRK